MPIGRRSSVMSMKYAMLPRLPALVAGGLVDDDEEVAVFGPWFGPQYFFEVLDLHAQHRQRGVRAHVERRVDARDLGIAAGSRASAPSARSAASRGRGSGSRRCARCRSRDRGGCPSTPVEISAVQHVEAVHAPWTPSPTAPARAGRSRGCAPASRDRRGRTPASCGACASPSRRTRGRRCRYRIPTSSCACRAGPCTTTVTITGFSGAVTSHISCAELPKERSM